MENQSIAHPVIEQKYLKKIGKLIKRLSKIFLCKRGTREVTKSLRKNKETCFLLIAANSYPIDVISHLPIMSEDRGIPYSFVPNKQDLRFSSKQDSETTCVLLIEPGKKEYPKLYKKYKKMICMIRKLNS